MTSSLPNKLFEGQTGFPTPNAPPEINGCRVFYIPSDEEWFALFMAALYRLTYSWAWYKNGTMTQDEAANAWSDIIDASNALALEGTCQAQVETPYWDDATDVDANEDADTQTWYGAVTDIFAPPDGITFEENLQLWSWAGLVAIAATPAAAISFVTLSQRFIIAVRGQDVGETVRVIVDAEDAGTIDTTGHAGEIVEMQVVGNPANDTHQLYLIKTS